MENQLLQTRGSVILRKFREPDFPEFYRQGHEPEILKNLCPLFADRLQNEQQAKVMKTVFPELIRHIFTHTSAILILGHILAENDASVRMVTSSGLVERPDLMQWVIKDGQQLKLCHYELPREKWEPVSQSA